MNPALTAAPVASLPTPPDPRRSNNRLVGAVAFLLCVAALLLLLAGCASVVQDATTTTTGTNGVTTTTQAHSSIKAIGDARTIVDKVRSSAGKTSSVGASGVSEETTSTNLVNGVADIVGAAVSAAVKATVKP